MAEQDVHFTVFAKEPLGFLQLHTHIYEMLADEYDCFQRKILIFCIGCEHYIGDLLGPLVGMEIEGTSRVKVYGSLARPIHAGSLKEEIDRAVSAHDHPVIVAVDACLGAPFEVGRVEVWKGGLRAGLAMGSDLPAIGDIAIVGIVNSAEQPALTALQNTPLIRVVEMAKCIGRALNLLIYRIDTEWNAAVQPVKRLSQREKRSMAKIRTNKIKSPE